ncbi:MAG: signal peptidase II [Ignavibacteriaceae bacterium]
MRVLYVSLLVVIIDQITKLSVKGFSIPFLNINYKGMFEGERIKIIGDFFRITFIENPGMAFGIDPGINWKLWVSIFSLAASVGLVLYIYLIRNQAPTLRIALAFILGGAAGNLIDRIFYGIFYGYDPLFYGKVVDFFDFDFFDVTILGKSYERWPIFNIADSAVTIGVFILLFFYKRFSKEEVEIKDAIFQTITENNPADADPDLNFAENNSKKNLNDDKPDKGKEISF